MRKDEAPPAALPAAPHRSPPGPELQSRPEPPPEPGPPSRPTTRPRRVDLVVVGGSFAGLSAAEEAARRGLTVLLVERKRHPGVPCSTTGLLPADALPSVRPPAALLGDGLRAVRLGSRRTRSGKAWATFEDEGLGLTPTDTPALLALLAERAAVEGAELRFGSSLQGVSEIGSGSPSDEAGSAARFRVTLDDEVVVADRLIAADGARSLLAARLDLPRPERLLLGVEHHLEVRDPGALPPDAVSLVVDGTWAPGYLAWAFAGLDGAWQVGVLGLFGPGSPGARRRGAPATALASFTRWLATEHGFDAGPSRETRAGLVPVGGPVRGRTRAGIRLAGDAAGHASPLTAGGIGRAADSGRLAVRELVGDLTSGADLRRLEARCAGLRRVLHGAWQLTRLPGAPSLLMPIARTALGARAAMSVLFGGTARERRAEGSVERHERSGVSPLR